ncbi:MAG: M48 family metallopeptidase [Candidatus Rifleibacteriota bacterium]
MTAEKIEKIFWLVLIFWIILRLLLLGAQYFGNTDPQYYSRVKQHFTDQQIKSGKEYSLYGFWVKFVYGFLYVGILVLMLRLGIFSRIYQSITDYCGEGLLKNELCFTVFLLAFMQLLSLPYSYYMGYMREVSMGFSNLSSSGWFLRYFKASIINILIQSVGIVLLLKVIRISGEKWFISVPVFAGIFITTIIVLSPVLVTPLFYEQKPLKDGELRSKILKIAEKADMKTDKIFVINESKFSKHTNAYFTGIGPYRRIVLYDNLINSHTVDEAALIFAHEAGHWKHNHVAKGITSGIISIFLICLLLKLIYPSLHQVHWFGLKELASAANLPFFLVVMILFQLFTAPVESQISQYMERQADRAALQLTGLKNVYISAAKKLALDNKTDLLPSRFRVFWLYSHPPTIERIELSNSFNSRKNN